MCTVVVGIAPGGAIPLVIGANRDEMLDRPWDPPGAWWPGQPDVVAGRDRLAGGTWMGLNRAAVIAAVLNRAGSLGPAAGKRSRGELPLRALRHGSAAEAAGAIVALDAGLWRSFNMVLADRDGAIFVRGLGAGRPQARSLSSGVHMITAHDPDDPASPRVARHLPRFRAVGSVAAAVGEIGATWLGLLADAEGPPEAALNIRPTGGFGTASSSLVTLGETPVWLFAPGAPDRTKFTPVRIALSPRPPDQPRPRTRAPVT